MLRNAATPPRRCFAILLNEVLSLNAQEFCLFQVYSNGLDFLNEVLSLNAQECLHRAQACGALVDPQ